jgi:hypothetical protein
MRGVSEMATAEILEFTEEEAFNAGPYLRLVAAPSAPRPFRQGPSLTLRRATRARAARLRRRAVVGLVLIGAITILALPGHTFGATNSAGLSSDLANSTVLAPGMDYVVQSGDTINSIAQNVNPVDPSYARALLVRELSSSVVVSGEHVLIP